MGVKRFLMIVMCLMVVSSVAVWAVTVKSGKAIWISCTSTSSSRDYQQLLNQFQAIHWIHLGECVTCVL